ncbi:MAG TPA: aminotransferase class V-fold PLP-dependent enzyme [Bryobacteraceae bacterium]|nr:aminotransferase class V-fold PLP-dependent enzyme [Bryobacteraceae bacterium]
MLRCYFDHNATTPVSSDILDVFTRVSRDCFGNASSIHQYGQAARQELERARGDVAHLIGCSRNEIVWTSGGTEADNLAIFVKLLKRSGHILTSSIEHPAVLSSCRRLERDGVPVTYVAPGPGGTVDPNDVQAALRPNTVLISIMHVNSETGVIQPLQEIAAIARYAGAALHSDGVQAAGKLPVNVCDLDVDLYTLSAHKMYAPKGVGALFIRKGVELDPLL